MPASRSSSKKKEPPREIQVSPVAGIKPYTAKKGEKFMNKKQLEHFHAVLLAWRRELEEEITRTVQQMRDEPENPPDPNDRASQETDMSLELRSRDRERKLIKKIDESLKRMESGDYGYCENCGVEIGLERLEARPTAEMCIDCKTQDELREKQTG
jgi:DnaK suppressor protein